MPTSEFKFLGHIECQLPSGLSLALQTRKAEVLLAYLVLNPDIRHARDKLMNLLWSNRSEEQARNSLRQALSTIKKSLVTISPLPISIDRTTVRFDLGSNYVDVFEFEQLAGASDIESLSKAANLYRGEFLEGITIHDAKSEEWLSHERDRFKRLLIEVLSNLSQIQLSNISYQSAITTAERLVKLDPLYETGWRSLMRAHNENGDRNHALLAFKRCQDILFHELGVEPEMETSHLRKVVLDGQITKEVKEVIKDRPSSQDADTNTSILVLPFENLSGDSEQEYFSDGITESIILNLSLFNGLIVKSRHSSFAFKSSMKSISEIAQELEVQYIVEGSIRKSRNKIRITAQLIESNSGNQLWGKRYDSEIEDIFDLEQELSQTIAGTISGRIGQDIQRLAIRKPAKDLKSYDYLLRGNYHLEKFTVKDLTIAKKHFQKCLEFDPDCAEAHTGMANTLIVEWMENWATDRNTTLTLASHHIKRALELEPNNAYVHAYMADNLMISREFNRAKYHADKSIELNPTLPDGYAIKAWFLGATGQHKESLKYGEICMRIDPYHPWLDWITGETYLQNEQYEQAIDVFRSLAHPPTDVYAQIAACHAGLGETDKARVEMKTYHELAIEQMSDYPSNIEQWRTLWYEACPYKHDEDFEKLFDLLLQAGLCDPQ